jgi:uncharacterized protein YqeY
MHPKEQLQADLKQAMKSGDKLRKTTIRMTLAAIKNAEIDKRRELSEEEAAEILLREIKQRRDSIAEAEGAGRNDVVAQEHSELEILEAYLPKQLSREEIEAEACAIIETLGAQGSKDTGKVMGALMPHVKGRADGKLVSEVVRELLGG